MGARLIVPPYFFIESVYSRLVSRVGAILKLLLSDKNFVTIKKWADSFVESALLIYFVVAKQNQNKSMRKGTTFFGHPKWEIIILKPKSVISVLTIMVIFLSRFFAGLKAQWVPL